jgi:hypothetical protein
MNNNQLKERKNEKNVSFSEDLRKSKQVDNSLLTQKLDQFPAREEPSRDIEFNDKEFTDMYHQHLRRKEEIRANIEAMEREKHFLEQLNPNEVAIMF